MSARAIGWAFQQRVGPKPKVVLLALADQADDRNGHVKYGPTDTAFLATKAGVGRRSFYRYVQALELEGLLERVSGKGVGQPNEYRLCLERLP